VIIHSERITVAVSKKVAIGVMDSAAMRNAILTYHIRNDLCIGSGLSLDPHDSYLVQEGHGQRAT
jgi:hypothetical protein